MHREKMSLCISHAQYQYHCACIMHNVTLEFPGPIHTQSMGGASNHCLAYHSMPGQPLAYPITECQSNTGSIMSQGRLTETLQSIMHPILDTFPIIGYLPNNRQYFHRKDLHSLRIFPINALPRRRIHSRTQQCSSQ